MIRVLVEDEQQRTFAQRLLEARGVGRREMYFLPVPGASGGAGERYVRSHFAEQVAECRRRRIHKLLAMTDADNLTVEERRRHLEDTLDSPRVDGEPIAVLVPKRNIETWLQFLAGNEAVDEETDYKSPHARPQRCRQEARRMVEHCRTQEAPLLASMRDGCNELERLS